MVCAVQATTSPPWQHCTCFHLPLLLLPPHLLPSRSKLCLLPARLPACLPACACARRSRGPGSEEKLHNPHHHDPASSMPWRFKTGMHALHFCAACDNRWALSMLLARFPDAVDAR